VSVGNFYFIIEVCNPFPWVEIKEKTSNYRIFSQLITLTVIYQIKQLVRFSFK